MAVIPSSKLVEFINQEFDNMIRYEERRQVQRSNFNKENDRKRYEIKSDTSLREDEKIDALKNWKNTNEYKTKKLKFAGKENFLNIFIWQCWYLIEKEAGGSDKDIFDWITIYLSERGYLKQNTMSKYPKYTINDIKRVVEFVESNIDKDHATEHLRTLTDHIYGIFKGEIINEDSGTPPDYELLWTPSD